MNCTSRRKVEDIRPEQKWDFISLNDFKSTSCLNPFAYAYLWISLLISIAVYLVDIFTAYNLLAFGKWSGEIKPYIPLKISKWIFSVCIILSVVNLAYEQLRAARVMKRGAVSESYLDPLAVRLESIRITKKGRGWRRFLVFAELTKSKKGVEYVALFTYFSFQTWIRIILCQGPRQVINALTLWSVFQLQLDPTQSTDVGSAFVQFFKNIGIVAKQNEQQAVILSGMLFTLVIWVFGALSLLLGVLFYILFLWHYIPNHDGGLTGYCERKVNTRLAAIVSVKVNKAIAEEERKRNKAVEKALKKGETPVLGRQATLPTLFEPKNDDKLPDMPMLPMLHENGTMSTLPLYTSRPGTPADQPPLPGFELDSLGQKRPFAPRTNTSGSYASNAPLIGNASAMGYDRPASPAPSLPGLPSGYSSGPQRSVTNSTNASDSSSWNRGPMGNRPTMRGPGDAMNRSNTPTGMAPSAGLRMPYDAQGRSSPAPGAVRPQFDAQGRSSPAPSEYGIPRTQFSSQGRSSPGPGPEYGRSSPAPGRQYQTYGGANNSSSPAPSQPYRSVTDPINRDGISSPAPRSGTAPIFRDGPAGAPHTRLGSSSSNISERPPRLASPGIYNSNGANGRTNTPTGMGPGIQRY